MFSNRSNYVQGDFKAGRLMLKENTSDILLVPIVVTTTDVQDFDFSIPIFKTWYVTINEERVVYCRMPGIYCIMVIIFIAVSIIYKMLTFLTGKYLICISTSASTYDFCNLLHHRILYKNAVVDILCIEYNMYIMLIFDISINMFFRTKYI